jgi:hypothetical protein
LATLRLEKDPSTLDTREMLLLSYKPIGYALQSDSRIIRNPSLHRYPEGSVALLGLVTRLVYTKALVHHQRDNFHVAPGRCDHRGLRHKAPGVDADMLLDKHSRSSKILPTSRLDSGPMHYQPIERRYTPPRWARYERYHISRTRWQ